MKLIYFIIVFSLFSCNQGDSQNKTQITNDNIILVAHKYIDWFMSSELDSLLIEFKDNKFTLDRLEENRTQVMDVLGDEVQILNERYSKRNENQFAYERYSRFSKTDNPVHIYLLFDNKGKVYNFFTKTTDRAAESKYSNYKTKTDLQLPFHGEWYVLYGGRTFNLNTHVPNPSQRFACDFVIVKNHSRFKINETINKNYYCFGEKIFSPGQGIVYEMVNNINDNKPWIRREGAGNYIIIDHQNGEFSFLAHLKEGSIVAKKGDKLKAGQFIGLCGNSGYSPFPHLHYHLQNSPFWDDGEGLPAQFQFYSSDKVEISLGEPIWNQIVKNKNDK